MNTLTNLLILVLLSIGFITIPKQIWFGRTEKPIFRKISERGWNQPYRPGINFDNVQQMYWYVIDTKIGTRFTYYEHTYGVYMYID